MERFKIYPSIGIARLGGSADFFLSSETSQELGVEIGNDGHETILTRFKDGAGLIKRQGARFRVFELDEATSTYKPLDEPSAEITWRVHLVNKKAAVQRPGAPPLSPADVPLPLRSGNTAELTIDGGEQKISGPNKGGVLFDQGKYKTTAVYLGELKTDEYGNLIVLGGHGLSKSPSSQPIGNYYYSKDWYDDTADGYVKASVKLQDGTSIEVSDAWVIIAPPDFAPEVKGLVTLYDIIEQVAIDNGSLMAPAVPSFVYDVWPIIERFSNLTWVSNYSDYSIPYAQALLADTAAANQAKRKEVRVKVLGIEDILAGHVSGIKYQLTQNQKSILQKWESGNFFNDLAAPADRLASGERLIRTVLDSTVGQGFCPGIEGGVILKNPSIYSGAFHLDSSKVSPGDITGLMALPWQADFLKCNTNWWPTQRPDTVNLAGGGTGDWARGITNHQSLISNFNKLGVVRPDGARQVEDERTL